MQQESFLQPGMATILEIDTSRLVTKTLHCYNDHGKHTLVYLPTFACLYCVIWVCTCWWMGDLHHVIRCDLPGTFY